jgi:hypothetical protein
MHSINKRRLNSNPLEQAFVDAWGKINDNDKLLKCLLDRTHSNQGNHVPTDVEREVAVTVIQWLGTLVGQGFLRDVEERYA